MDPRKWRKDAVKSKNGPSWRLMTGRNETRKSIWLGQIPEEDVERCLVAMQAEEDRTVNTPLYGRLERLAEEPGGPEKVRQLLRDGGLTIDLFGAPPSDYGAFRLEDYVNQVWAEVREKQSADTWEREDWLWRRKIIPKLGHVRLRELDHVKFDAFISALTNLNGKPASWNTKRLTRAAYAALMTHAEKMGHIEQVHRFYDLRESGTVLPEARPLSDDQLLDLIACAPSTMHAALFAFSFETGARPSEVKRVQWEDIDWTRTKKTPHGRVAIRGSKNAKAKRVLPLLQIARLELETWWKDSGYPKTGHVFHNNGEPYATSGGWKKALKAAAKKAKIDDRRIFPYLARHTYVTAALDAGASLVETAQLGGHTDTKMVRKVYDHGTVADRVDVEKLPKRS